MPQLLLPLAALVTGLATGLFFPSGLLDWPPAVAVAASAAAILARGQGLPVVTRACGTLALVAVGVGWGGLTVERAGRPPLVRWLDERVGGGGWPVKGGRLADPVRLRGRLMRDAAPASGGVQLSVWVTAVSLGGAWEPVEGGVSLTVAGTLADERRDGWRAGRTVELPATLRTPTRYLNHGVADAARALARRKTPLVGTVKSAALVDLVRRGRPWDEGAAWVRARVRHAMARHVAPRDPTAAAIGTAIVIGDRAQMAPELTARLQEAGTYHVVAISGGNIAVLAGGLLALLWAVGVRFGAAAVLAALLLAAHAWVVGGGPSVVRATVMAVVYLGLRVVDQRTAPARAVAIGGGVMVAADPLALTDAGFWLTFGATGALLALARLWPASSAGPWWQAPLVVSGASAAVEVMLMPVSAFVFQRVTLAGIVANLGAVPAMAVVQVAASACVLADAAGLPMVAGWAGAATEGAASALVGSSRVVDLAPWTTWRVPSPPPAVIGAYYLLLVGWWLGRGKTSSRGQAASRASGVGAAAVWTWMALAPQTLSAPGAGAWLRLTALDVGQGDALLVEFPNGRTLVVDAGGSAGGAFDVGDRVVGPALRFRGLGRLDYVAITHGDLDHIGGVPALLRDFRPTEVWMGVPVPASPLDAAARDAASRAHASVRRLRTGDRLDVGGVEVRVHHPPEPDWERQRPRNDDSLVLELRHGDVSLLLTGDIGAGVEASALAGLDLRPIVILKAPHHGSAASSSAAFLSAVRPRAVLVSAGRGNPFGHPAPAAIERYAAAGGEVFRTDRDGQITLATDGRWVEIRSYTGLRWRYP